MTALSRKADDIDLFPRIVAKAQEERELIASASAEAQSRLTPTRFQRGNNPPLGNPQLSEGDRKAAEKRRYVLDTIGFCAAMSAVCVFGIFIGWLAYRLG